VALTAVGEAISRTRGTDSAVRLIAQHHFSTNTTGRVMPPRNSSVILVWSTRTAMMFSPVLAAEVASTEKGDRFFSLSPNRDHHRYVVGERQISLAAMRWGNLRAPVALKSPGGLAGPVSSPFPDGVRRPIRATVAWGVPTSVSPGQNRSPPPAKPGSGKLVPMTPSLGPPRTSRCGRPRVRFRWKGRPTHYNMPDFTERESEWARAPLRGWLVAPTNRATFHGNH
jgi:hypothetical protein